MWYIKVTYANIPDEVRFTSDPMSKSDLLEVIPVLCKPSMFGTGDFIVSICPV